MTAPLPNCWEIKKCGREKGGSKVAELGECIASKEGLGHSCWAVAGTLCGGVVQGTEAQKEGSCIRCKTYIEYNRMSGEKGRNVRQTFPNEEKKYNEMLIKQLKVNCEIYEEAKREK